MDILEKIDKLRQERHWSINNLALEAMLTQSTVNNLYLRQSEPKLSTLRAICNAFGITLAEFFADDTEGDVAQDEELLQRVKELSPSAKKALLTLLRTK